MIVEHVALNVPDPRAAADWYAANLGLVVLLAGEGPPFARYLGDRPGGGTVFELYNNPEAPVPDYRRLAPLTLHLAFVSSDVKGDRERLLAAGATPEGEITVLDNGDELAMLRDPWGVPLQLANRARPFREDGQM